MIMVNGEWGMVNYRICFSFTTHRSPLFVRRPVPENAHDLGLGGNFAVNFGFAAHLLHFISHADRHDLKHQSISRNDRPSETGVFYAAEIRYLAVAVLELTQCQDGADLGQGLYLQNSRHYRSIRKMALKEIFVDGHLLNADDLFPGNKLDYLVHQQKRVAVRQDLLNSADV